MADERGGPDEAGISDVLHAARYVSLSDKLDPGASGLVKMLWKMKKETPEKFLAYLRGLEKDHRMPGGRQAESVAAASAGEDLGTERCLSLVGRLLDEFEAEEKKRGIDV